MSLVKFKKRLCRPVEIKGASFINVPTNERWSSSLPCTLGCMTTNNSTTTFQPFFSTSINKPSPDLTTAPAAAVDPMS